MKSDPEHILSFIERLQQIDWFFVAVAFLGAMTVGDDFSRQS